MFSYQDEQLADSSRNCSFSTLGGIISGQVGKQNYERKKSSAVNISYRIKLSLNLGLLLDPAVAGQTDSEEITKLSAIPITAFCSIILLSTAFDGKKS